MLVRGFNQAVEISLPIMRLFSLSLDVVSVYRPLPGTAQSSLDAKTRRKNIRGAFMVSGSITAETVIIIDDVITTGATVSAMAKTLKSAGAKTVLVWVVAAA